MFKKINILVAGLCFFSFFLPAVNAGAATPMPEFYLPAVVDGVMVNSEEFKGKTMLVTFFATWCGSCVQETPTLNKLQEKFAAKDFSVVGFSVDEGGAKVVKEFIQSRDIKYPVFMADRSIVQGFGGIDGIPTSFLVNKDGFVVKKYPGYIPFSFLARDIKTIL